MRIIMKSFVILTLLMAALSWSVMGKEQGDKAKRQPESLYKGAGTPIYSILNINNFTTWIRYDGPGNLAPSADNQGIYPRGTGNVIYLDGIYVGAKCYTDAAKTKSAPRQLVRVGGKGYGFGLRPGKVNGSGATAVRMDANDPTVRIYRVRRDYAAMSNDELKRDAAELNEVPIANVTDAQIAAVKGQYEKDWKEWPVTYGAPYIDRNKNGKFDAPPAFSETFTVDSLIAQNRDEPGVAGSDPNSPADQVIWTVANDLDVAQTLQFQSSEPMGLEFQFTLWGYKRTDALGNLYFKRARIINKGGVEIDDAKHLGYFYLDSVFVANFSDIDLGAFSDDVAGCDTTLSLAFVYNGGPIDLTYQRYGLPPPAAGYDFLAGPAVKSVGDSAVFDLKRKYGWKNLPMTGFFYYSAGSPYSDPCNRETGGYLCNTGQWWKMLRGFAPLGTLQTADQPFANGPWPVSKFPLSGDPVTGKGFIDGLGTDYSFPPGDRRIGSSSGPFAMAPGDTQDVVMGVVAGMGADRMSSVAVMKFNDRFVQNTFDALFQVPRPPKAPNLNVAELDGEVVLDWASDIQRTTDIENTVSQPGGYKFEGYVVYQLPSRSSRLSASKRVATYDLMTDPTVVLDQQFDQGSGQILSVPVEFGSNNGIQRIFDFKRDYIKDIDKLYNGQEYYLAVTAYSVATVPGYLPAALESAPVVLTVRPQAPRPGVKYTGKYGVNLAVKLTKGKTDVVLPVVMIDPTRTKATTYQITFGAAMSKWFMKDNATGATLYSSTNLGSNVTGNTDDDANYPVINGVRPLVQQINPILIPDSTVFKPQPPGVSNKGVRFTDGSDLAAALGGALTTGSNGSTYLGNFGSSYDMTKLVKIEIRFGPGNGSKAYRLRRTGGGTEYMIQTNVIAGPAPNGEGFVSIPFSAWDMDNAGGPRQLTIAWRDQDNSATWNPPVGGDGTEVVFIYNKTYDAQGGQFFYPTNPVAAKKGPAKENECTVGAAADIMYLMSLSANGTQITGTEASVGAGKIIARPTYALNDACVFEFTTVAPSYSADQAKVDAEKKIGVYPNPYYAFNPAETNRFNRFVTFNNLPPKATIRIFNLAGHLVRRIDKDDQTTFVRWDLTNASLYPVASGVYICYVECADIGATKIVKLAVIQEQEVLDSY